MKNPADIPGTVRLEQEAGFRFRVTFASGAPSFVTDEPPPLGPQAGPDPTALLAAAVGNCLASSLLFCAQKTRVDLDGLTVDVAVIPDRDPSGRLRIGRLRVHMSPTLSQRNNPRLRPCLELFESYCVVTESVRRGIPVDVDIVPVGSDSRETSLSG